MQRFEFLQSQQEAISDEWLKSVCSTYNERYATFLRDGKDRFANPVGFVFKTAIAGVVHSLISGEETRGHLTEVVRVRAVQEFSPSEAVGFVYPLRDAIEKVCPRLSAQEKSEIQKRIDELALEAFDIYMECREKLAQIKINETRRALFKLLERADGSRCLGQSKETKT
jgi:hypothetical protein